MSSNGYRLAQLEKARQEQLRLQHVQQQAQAEFAACGETIGAIQNAAVQHLARDGLASVRQDLDAGAAQIASAPDRALRAIHKAGKRLHRVIAEAEATAHRWSQQRAQSEARLAEARQQADTTRQTASGKGRAALQQADESIAQAHTLHHAGRYPEAVAACDQAQTFLQRAAEATLEETVRREVVRGLVATLTEMGFSVEGPQLVNPQTDSGIVTLVGQLPSGRLARFDVHLDGRMTFDFDGYEGRACGKDLEQIERSLQERFGVQLGPRQITWKNPDRISKGARDLPSGGRQHGAPGGDLR